MSCPIKLAIDSYNEALYKVSNLSKENTLVANPVEYTGPTITKELLSHQFKFSFKNKEVPFKLSFLLAIHGCLHLAPVELLTYELLTEYHEYHGETILHRLASKGLLPYVPIAHLTSQSLVFTPDQFMKVAIDGLYLQHTFAAMLPILRNNLHLTCAIVSHLQRHPERSPDAFPASDKLNLLKPIIKENLKYDIMTNVKAD